VGRWEGVTNAFQHLYTRPPQGTASQIVKGFGFTLSRFTPEQWRNFGDDGHDLERDEVGFGDPALKQRDVIGPRSAESGGRGRRR
jgi:hypothetical protein